MELGVWIGLGVGLGAAVLAALSGCASGEGPGVVLAASDGTDWATSTSDDGEGSGGARDLPACTPWSATRTPVDPPPRTMFVLDKSGSMRERWDHDGDAATPTVSRWWSLRTWLDSWAVDFEGRIEAGVQLFPDVDAKSTAALGCEMAPAPEVALGHLLPEMNWPIPNADEDMYGASPARLGVTQAVAALIAAGPGSPRSLILVTDGAANCRAGSEGADRFNLYDDELEQVVAAARADHGMVTYVVGIDIVDGPWTGPEVNPHEALSKVATAGGVPRSGAVPYYAVDGAGALDLVLDQIAQQVSCAFEIGSDVSDEDLPWASDEVEVLVDGSAIPFAPSCGALGAEAQAWSWADASAPHRRLELCGAACDGTQVEVTRGCPAP